MKLKNSLIIIISLFLVSALTSVGYAQEIKIGDELTIEKPAGIDYQHIYFPRKNFIIKQGGIADLKTVKNVVVVVTDIKYGSNNESIITIKRKDGRRFFFALRHVKANFEGAIENGELQV